ncbi:MAG: tetratricopeptide repeat protein [Bryobacter sp.]|nr:tetratricopeptide repeat protein [Bryobacter sp.]
MSPRLTKFAYAAFAVLLLNTAYLAAFAQATLFYMVNVLFHIFGGAVVVGLLVWMLRRERRWAAAFLTLGLASGALLAWQGNTHDKSWLLAAHIGVAILGVGLVSKRHLTALACLALLPLGTYFYDRNYYEPSKQLKNNALVIPTSMHEEGDAKGPFWPSPANTSVKGTIPSNFFMDSKLCGECHKDIYEQWNSSMHHFASFNNQYYRRSIEHMQEVQGTTQPSKWCAGCHDHAVFFNGRWEKPIKEQVYTPEAQNGLGCMSCHSITHVNGSVGNGGFVIEYPPLHELASSQNPAIKALDRFLTYADPEPHRRTFLKPFMREQSAEYCSTCHKVHLDQPVNDYRWMRGFNDYDNWQASGVSGHGARSFYYPPQSSTCNGCHMPLVAAQDPAARNGKVHSHRFAAANTAVPFVNGDKKQLEETTKFLQSGIVSVDLFAITPVEEMKGQMPMVRRAGEQQTLNSTMAVGEEADMGGQFFLREVSKVAAPLNTAQVKVEPGSTVRLDAVVRTRRVGHFFPGGTVDAYDLWLEVKGSDAAGRVFFWSGKAEDEGKGPVDKGAHFYRAHLLDGEGNHINKRNAWQARSSLYVRLIPPGAADTVHYRVKIPKSAKPPYRFEAKLNYRKFAHFYNQFAYEKRPDVSGPIKDRVPEIPTIVVASTVAQVEAGPTRWESVVEEKDYERWNDWGIGLLLQGDLKGAEYAFRRVTEADPDYADGWLNVARALIQEGQTDAAKPFLAEALKRNSSLGRIHFFEAMTHKADGDYAAALASLKKVEAQYPKDRVVLNQMGRLQFLQRNYKAAVATLERVLAIDTEDVQAHYNLMLAYRGLGDQEKSARAEKLFRRFKADESATAITGKPRQLSPEDNNERQMIHDHESISLP